MKNSAIALILFLLSTCPVFSQTVTNIGYQFSGNQILIIYDLSGPEGSVWVIDIHFSDDDGITWGLPLKNVTGDAGDSIKPGLRKKVYWDRDGEYNGILKKMKFQLVAEPDVFYAANSGVYTDPRDGIKYKWVRIGRQIWMAQNLNVGTQVSGDVYQSNNGKTEKYCYEDIASNCAIYGGLYRWDEIMQYTNTPGIQGICPENWRLPTDADWINLTGNLGGKKAAYGKIKALGDAQWKYTTKGTTNESGFSVLPGGVRNSNANTNSYNNLRNEAYFWSSSEFDSASAYAMGLGSLFMEVNIFKGLKSNAYSVRCIKD